MNYKLPAIIQGGMGAGVSGWRLARAVSRTGQLGVVSGTALDVILARRLQLGDPGGHVLRALELFPISGVAERILDRYYVPGGKAYDEPFRIKPMSSLESIRMVDDLLVAGNFVEVFLAKEGHRGQVGINYLEKIQLPTLASLYGAMLAGVDWVLMGAGIPKSVPGILDQLADGQPVELKMNVVGAQAEDQFLLRFDPQAFSQSQVSKLARPKFAAIVAAATLASMLLKRSNGRIDGFVVEGPTAGGHNAPPRGKTQLNEAGEPIYGERDLAKADAFRKLGLPFWLAGSHGTPEKVIEAMDAGAAGVQVGTAFAYCEESDLVDEIKTRVLQASGADEVRVFTDPVASPAGFPFKVVQLENTLSEQAIYDERPRVCDLGYLRHAYRKDNGKLGWRCPAEPVEEYQRKGGREEETCGRKCICNALLGNIGLGQVQKDGSRERFLVTSGDDARELWRFLKPGSLRYTAADVVEYLMSSLNTREGDSEPALASATMRGPLE